MTEKTYFIMFAFAFIFIVTQIGAMYGATILTGTENFTPPPIPTDPLGYVLYVFQNIAFFFMLMTVSTTFAFLGVILTILGVGVAWAVLELIRGV